MRIQFHGRIAFVALAGVGLAVAQAAQPPMPEGSQDTRIRYVDVVPKAVTPVPMYPGFVVHLVFQDGEKVRRAYTGAKQQYWIKLADNGLFLRMGKHRVATNLVVQTEHKTYYFDLVPQATPAKLKPGERNQNPNLVYRIGMRDHQSTVLAWQKDQAGRHLAAAEATLSATAQVPDAATPDGAKGSP